VVGLPGCLVIKSREGRTDKWVDVEGPIDVALDHPELVCGTWGAARRLEKILTKLSPPLLLTVLVGFE
jgi:hypothetical protein